ncbi:MAG: hypothetical protein KDI79_21240 [Anaerolineae bacterium]|nr:hypothetical protein [Anaerolineae bacterium]
MIRHRTVEEVKRYDIFKMIVTLVLIVILFFIFYSFIDRSPTEAVTEGGQPAGTEAIAETGESPTGETGGEEAETTDGALTETEAETPTTEETADTETTTEEASSGASDTDSTETSTDEGGSAELAAPTLNLPGAALAAGPLALSGTGAPGSDVEIMANGRSLGKAVVGADGTWTFDGTLDEPGDYEVVVNGLDADGNTVASAEAATLSLTAPTVDLVAPTIDLPEGERPAGKVTLTGTGAPGSQVEIVVDGESLGTTEVGADGTWTFDGTLDEPGDYEVVVNGLDADGNPFAPTKATTLSLAAPAVDVIAPTIDVLQGDLSAGEVTLTGAGTPGSEVEIVANGESLGTTTVGDDGVWAFDTSLDEPGDYEITVNSLTADGAVEASSEPITVSPIASVNATPEVTLPTFELPEGDLNAGELALTGTGAPGSQVEIMADGESLGTATVDDDGTWRFNNPFDKSGQVEIMINALDNQGRIITSTNAALYTIAATVESTIEATTEVTTVATAEATTEAEDEATAEATTEPDVETTGEATVEPEAEATTEATTEPEAEITAPTVTSPRTGTTVSPGRLSLQGMGTPGSQIEIMIDGKKVGTATVRSTGRWTFATTMDEPGDYDLVINSLDEDGEVVASSTPQTLSLAEPEDTATDTTGPTLDTPAENVTAGDVTLTGTGEPGSKVEIVVDGQNLGTATVDEDGTWRFTGTFDEPGDVEIVINALDAKGKIITSTDPTLYTIIGPTADASAPTLVSPLTGASLLTGRQTFRGTGEPGSEVEVVVDGKVIGTATVRSNGAWSLSADIEEAGEVEVTVNALDETGGVIASSEPATVTMAASEETTASTGEEAAEPGDSTSAADDTGLVCEEEYVVVADDWLSKLAEKYFGDLFLYPAIVTATSEKHQVDDSFAAIDNPDVIEPGWKLCIVSAEAARELVAAGN